MLTFRVGVPSLSASGAVPGRGPDMSHMIVGALTVRDLFAQLGFHT